MTSPPVPIIKQEGIGDRLGQALAPLAAMLEAKREQQNKMQQFYIQKGQIAAQLEQLDEQKRQFNEQQKSLKEAGQSVSDLLSHASSDEGFQQLYSQAAGKLVAAGAQTAVKSLADQIHEREVQGQFRLVAQKYAKAAGGDLSKIPPEQRLAMLYEMQAIDPENTGIANNISTLTAAQRPRQGSWAKSVENVGGQWRTIYRNPQTGEEKMGGIAATPGTAITETYGRTDQTVSARAGLNMRLGLDTMKSAMASNPSVADEVAPVLSKMAIAKGVNVLGLSAEQALGQYGLSDLSPEAQEYLTGLFNWRAAKVFGEGGKSLTINEIVEATRQFMPYPLEDEKSRAAKWKMIEDQTTAMENSGGPATQQIRQGTSLDTSAGRAGAPTVRSAPNPVDARINSLADSLRAKRKRMAK